jgi:hypothetical protein
VLAEGQQVEAQTVLLFMVVPASFGSSWHFANLAPQRLHVVEGANYPFVHRLTSNTVVANIFAELYQLVHSAVSGELSLAPATYSMG